MPGSEVRILQGAPNYFLMTRNILITGASSGIGYQAARQLVQEGHNLILPCRNKARSDYLMRSLKSGKESQTRKPGNISTPICDLSDLISVSTLSQQLLSDNTNINTPIALELTLIQFTITLNVLHEL